MPTAPTTDDVCNTLPQYADMHPDEEVPRCPECGGWITDDGFTTGEMDCCYWCQP